MSEYFDLSKYTHRENEKNTLNIGWLEKNDFTKGKVSQIFLEIYLNISNIRYIGQEGYIIT